MQAALDDIIVVDLTRVLAGPYATMLLGDLGARIIKIEQPVRGDDTRHWGPPFTANGESAYFLCVNRNKESVTIDLKSPAGIEVLRDMLRIADVVVENFKVGGMAAMGLDYAAVKALNPGIIYCSITGYGQTGPYRMHPGYDVVIEAQGGIMSITGSADGEPVKVGVAIVDITAGMHAAMAILAALHHRSRTGHGQYIDIALLDTQIGWLANIAGSYLVSGEPPTRHGNAHPSIVPYQTFPTADGVIMVGAGNDAQFVRLCSALGHPQWAEDPGFRTNRDRVAHRTTLVPLLTEAFRAQPTTYWSERLLALGIPSGPVNDIPTALADPHVRARGMVQTVVHPQTGEVPLVGPVPKLSDTPAAIRLPPPLLGEHTHSVLTGWLGYDGDTYGSLLQSGAI
jgi:crotonobetainyl-CoA:carnitine CoA-transferase CaiB-like acyl-CoA transferase